MKLQPPLRTGEIYWLDNCPPLEGDVAKRRPVIVLSPKDRLAAELLVLVVATSASALSSESDRIRLPSIADDPRTKTGLSKPCWAVPRWHLLVKREHLRDKAGYIGGDLLRRVMEAVLRRMV